MSVSRKPAPRTLPGSLHFRKAPAAVNLSIVRVEYPKRSAASARRINRGVLVADRSQAGLGGDRKKAITRARSPAETSASDISAARIICIVASRISSVLTYEAPTNVFGTGIQRQRDVSRKRANNKPINKRDMACKNFVKSYQLVEKYAGLIGRQYFQQAFFCNSKILFGKFFGY
jgi:hypothetical protein